MVKHINDNAGYELKSAPIMQEIDFSSDKIKNELANEIGVPIPASGLWGDKAAMTCQYFGGHTIKKVIDNIENQVLDIRDRRR